MAVQPNTQGAVMTVDIVCARQNLSCVIPISATAAFTGIANTSELLNWFTGTLAALWKNVLAGDCYLAACFVEGMVRGVLVPGRELFAPATYVGTQGTESYSPNASMLIAFYDEAIPVAGHPRSVGKSFVGPPPEAVCAADNLDAVFVAGALQALGDAMKNGFIGAGTGIGYQRAMARDRTPGENIVEAQVAVARDTIFTQKRRVLPVL